MPEIEGFQPVEFAAIPVSFFARFDTRNASTPDAMLVPHEIRGADQACFVQY
jgi:hypothetical protein